MNGNKFLLWPLLLSYWVNGPETVPSPLSPCTSGSRHKCGCIFVLLTFCYLKTLMSEWTGRFYFATVKPCYNFLPLASCVLVNVDWNVTCSGLSSSVLNPQGNILDNGMSECSGVGETWVWVLICLLANWPTWLKRTLDISFLIHKNGGDFNFLGSLREG